MGRPRKENALTGAQRQARFRAKKEAVIVRQKTELECLKKEMEGYGEVFERINEALDSLDRRGVGRAMALGMIRFWMKAKGLREDRTLPRGYKVVADYDVLQML